MISVTQLVRNIILFTCICLSLTSHAFDYYMDWLPAHATLRYRINFSTHKLEKEISTDQWEIQGDVIMDEQELMPLSAKSAHPDFFILPNQKIRFTIQGTGLVYDFDLRTSIFKRIDRTIHSGYNFSATHFYRNDVLYSVGGEGFWNYNKHITYFDDKTTKEWEILRPKNKGPEMMSDGFQGYSKQDDAFYSGGSNNKNYLEDEKIDYLKVFQRFNFKNKTWEVLGNISDKIPLAEHRIIYWNGTHFVQMARDRIYIIDPMKNEIHQYKDNGTYFEGGSSYYISDDTIKYFHYADRGPLQIIPVNSLLKKSTYLGKFYQVDYTKYFLGGIIACITLVLGVWIYRKKRKIEPTFDPLERKLLQALLAAGENYIPTNELNDILECGTKSQENQRRIRFMTIKQVNEKLAFYYNINNAIERTASTEDKRLITYRLKKGVREKIKAIL
ncbi:hypothetical protein V7S78_05105 [Aquirufa regiilacus]